MNRKRIIILSTLTTFSVAHPCFPSFSFKCNCIVFSSFVLQLWIILNWSDRQSQKERDSPRGRHTRLGCPHYSMPGQQGSEQLVPPPQLLTLNSDSRGTKWWNLSPFDEEKTWSHVTSMLPACSSFFFLFSLAPHHHHLFLDGIYEYSPGEWTVWWTVLME